MNLQAKTFHFFALSIIIFFSACKSKRNLGQEFVPDNEKIGIYTDSVFLEVSTLKVDSTFSAYPAGYVMGNMAYDNVIDSKAIVYTKLNYSQTTVDASAVCDSMIVTLNTVNSIFGDTLADFTLRLFETKQTIDTSFKYTSSYIPIEDNPIGETTFNPRRIRSSNDSVVRFHLDKTYADKVLGTIKNSATNSLEEFHKMIKGLAWVGDDQNKNLLLISPQSITMRLYMTINGISYSIDFSSYNSSNQTLAFNYINYTSTLKGNLATLKNRDTLKSTDNGGLVYLQNFSALNLKTVIPSLDRVGNKEDNIIINRAEIVLKRSADLNKFDHNYTYYPPLYVGYSNKENQYVRFEGNFNLVKSPFYSNSTDSRVTSRFDVNNENYRIDVTEYIQKLIDQKIDNRHLIIYSESLAYITLGDPSQNPKNFMLKIHYTKLK